MNLIHKTSLSDTLDEIGRLDFERQPMSPEERNSIAEWIAARQGKPNAYADTFAGFPREIANGIVVFTGERFTSASARHVSGEEACRTLRLLKVNTQRVQASLKRAEAGLLGCLARAERDPRNTNPGVYCCGKCSVGMWRNLLSGGLDRQEERLRLGVGVTLRANRTGEGKWRIFPFWYTVLALTEMDIPEARTELSYAASVLERTTKRPIPSSVYGKRRQAVSCRALSVLLAP